MGKEERKQYFSNMIKSIEELEKENSELKSLNSKLKSQLEKMYLDHQDVTASFVERDTYAENRIMELEQEVKVSEELTSFTQNKLNIATASLKLATETLAHIQSKWYYKLFA